MAFLAFLLLLLFGVFGVAGGSSSSSGSGTAQPERAITLADSGRTVTLRPGEQAVLRLPSRWVWAEPTTTGRAIELSDISYFRDTGTKEWGLTAARRGTWSLRTTGQPGSKRFSLRIRVR